MREFFTTKVRPAARSAVVAALSFFCFLTWHLHRYVHRVRVDLGFIPNPDRQPRFDVDLDYRNGQFIGITVIGFHCAPDFQQALDQTALELHDAARIGHAAAVRIGEQHEAFVAEHLQQYACAPAPFLAKLARLEYTD